MTTTRFDPEADESYGECEDCGEVQQTEADSKVHMNKTFKEAREKGKSSGHRIRITNPSRSSRVQSRTGSICDDALDRAMSDLERLVDDGDATADEVRDSLWMYSDFREAWDEWNEEDNS